MTENTTNLVDPTHNKCDGWVPVPADAEFVCSYDFNVQGFLIEESAYERRTSTHAELWTENGVGSGMVVSVPLQDPVGTTPEVLLEIHFRGMVGLSWPDAFLKPGLLNEGEFRAIVDGIKKELDGNARQAEATRSEIIHLAEELGLGPEPTGTGPDHWQARCPETGHHLLISSSTDTFGCGYCRVKGGPEELRVLVRERLEAEARKSKMVRNKVNPR